MIISSQCENFSHYGYSFQIKLIYNLLKDKLFLEQIIDVLEEKYFEEISFIWIYKKIKEYFIKYRNSSTKEFFYISIKELEDSVLKESVVKVLQEIYNKEDLSEGSDFIKEKSIDFCKNQVLKMVILDSVDLLKYGKYEEIKSKIDFAMKVGMDRNIGHIYSNMFTERITGVLRKIVSTGWNVIDDIIDGGLGQGELGVVVSPSGGGKSWCLAHLGSVAVKNGLNVIHYTLELGENYVGLRYDSIFSGIPSSNLKYHKEEVEEIIGNLNGKLIIKYFPTKTARVSSLKSHVEKVKLSGVNPDLIIVDYGDLLLGSGTEKRFILENIYEELRGMAGELEVPIWTASQSSRESLFHDVIEADKISESYFKIMIADFVISLSRKIEDKLSNTARMHVIKNRFGKDGITYPTIFDTYKGIIELREKDSSEGEIITNLSKNGENISKKILNSEYKKHKLEEVPF